MWDSNPRADLAFGRIHTLPGRPPERNGGTPESRGGRPAGPDGGCTRDYGTNSATVTCSCVPRGVRRGVGTRFGSDARASPGRRRDEVPADRSGISHLGRVAMPAVADGDPTDRSEATGGSGRMATAAPGLRGVVALQSRPGVRRPNPAVRRRGIAGRYQWALSTRRVACDHGGTRGFDSPTRVRTSRSGPLPRVFTSYTMGLTVGGTCRKTRIGGTDRPSSLDVWHPSIDERDQAAYTCTDVVGSPL